MKSRLVDTVTSNEDHVRLRIFDGEIPVDLGACEIYRMALMQAASDLERTAKHLRRASASIAANARLS